MKTQPNLFGKIILFIFFSFIFSTQTFAQWTAPVNISPNATQALLNESMGTCIGTAGNAVHIVWTDRTHAVGAPDTSGGIYYINSIDTGLTWSVPVAITDTSANAWHPTIAVNGLNIHVAWMEIDPLNNANRINYYKRSLDGGSTWLPAIVLDSAVGDWPAITALGNIIYVVNDWHLTPTNSEIFFLRSMDNGDTWSSNQQLTFSDGRSEDEAIQAHGSHIHMTWNDNRGIGMKLYYKESADYGATWGPDVLLIPKNVYGPGISISGDTINLTCAQSASGPSKIHFVQSLDAGATWGSDINLTNDTISQYLYPYSTSNGSDIHITYMKGGGGGGQYLHSGDNGLTWDAPFTFFSGYAGITPFTAYSGCTLHLIYINNGDSNIYYMRNPIGNAGHCPSNADIPINQLDENISIYPNPFNSTTTLKPGGILKNASLTICNSMGQQVKQINNITGEMITLNRDNLPSGLYTIRLIDANKTFTHKLIITD